MEWFSEKFIEDCVAEAPSIFLGHPLKILSQQLRISGFIPDLIFEDDAGNILIAEVQQNALDRNHLYKCLEYRDLYPKSNGKNKPQVVLICESIPERYNIIIEAHGVTVHAYKREEIIRKAIENCPKALNTHLIKPTSRERRKEGKNSHPDPIKPYAWSKYDSLSDVYGFIVREIERCNLWKKFQDDNKNISILWDAQRVLDERHLYSGITDPKNWRIDNLITKPEGWISPDIEKFTRIRKPKATFDLFQTSKGNLSVRWFPDGPISWRRDAPHDWVQAPSTEPYAYQRPANEILFIKNLDNLHPSLEYYKHYGDGDERAAIDAMLLGLIWAMIQHVKRTISATIELNVLSEFQLTSGQLIKDAPFSERQLVTGWRIVSTEDIKKEEAKERIDEFNEKNNVPTKEILSILEKFLETSHKTKEDRSTRIAKELREKGHKITATPIRQLLNDLETTNAPEYTKILIHDQKRDVDRS